MDNLINNEQSLVIHGEKFVYATPSFEIINVENKENLLAQ